VDRGESWTGSGGHDLGPIGKYHEAFRYTADSADSTQVRINISSTLRYEAAEGAARPGLPFTIVRADFKKAAGRGTAVYDGTRGRISSAALATRLEGTLQVEIGGTNTTVELAQTQKTMVKTSDVNPLP
jgi:hypothetical protein